MTPKERLLAVLNREKPDRLPMDYWGTEEATRKVALTISTRSPSGAWKMCGKK